MIEFSKIYDPEETKLPSDVLRRMEATFKKGDEINFTLKRKIKKHSKEQRGYYFAVIVQMFLKGLQNLGHDDILNLDQAHEILKVKFLLEQKIDEETGELLYEKVKSFADLNEVECSIYIDRCIRWLNTFFKIDVPPPNSLKHEYRFPQFIQENERRVDYLARIESYINSLHFVDMLELYYKQNAAEWKSDEQIIELFRKRKNFLEKLA